MRAFFVCCVAVFAFGCKYNKETVPVDRDRVSIRVPHQQRIVALAVEEAVESLDLAKLSGKTVSLEMTGVFPHTNEDLLSYVLQRIESRLTKSGVRVIHTTPVLVVPTTSAIAVTESVDGGGTGSIGAITLADRPDFRLLIGVSWAGLDTRDKVRTDESLLTKQLGVAVGGLLGGLVLFTIADRTYGYVLASVSTVGGPAGAYMWSRYDSPFKHTYTLLGRVRVIVDALPNGDGKAFTVTGEGTSKVVIDESSSEGYMLR